jgi:hypothetical protein
MVQKVPKREKVILFGLLIVLNFIIRIPSIPHMKGVDAFFIQTLANSISTYGQANWWLHWSSVIGSYPHSYASSTPFLLSGVSQLTGLVNVEGEIGILLFSVLLGVFSAFSAFVLAGLLKEDFLFKYIVALFYSISQGILTFTTWEPSARGPFMVFMCFGLFLLLKQVALVKKLLLLALITAFLTATHHYSFFFLSMIGIYLFIQVVFNLPSFFSRKIEKYNINSLYIVILLLVMVFPFVTRTMISAGSKYDWMIEAIVVSLRYMGPVLLITISGILYMALKQNKTPNEWYLMIVFLSVVPFIYNVKYGIFILFLYGVIFAAFAFRNLLNNADRSIIFRAFCIMFVLSIVVFSSYYNHTRTGSNSDVWYMDESTYRASEWSFLHIPDGSHGFGEGLAANRLSATSDGHPIIPLGSAVDLSYGLINASAILPQRVSATSSYFYFEGFYEDKNGINLPGKVNWMLEQDIEYMNVKPLLDEYKFEYFIMSHVYSGKASSTIKSKKNSFYDNGYLSLWLI